MRNLTKTYISIVIPCRNEEKYIEECLKSVLSFLLPKGVSIEVLVMDGMSQDNTREIVKNISLAALNVCLVGNEGITQAHAMNKAIPLCKGEYIMRLDAHAKYPQNYLIKCLETAKKTGADNTGGIVITLKGGNSFQAGIVQAITTHKFGVGDSSFRTETINGETDTVPFGFFRKKIFSEIGYFDERLIRAQDYEFNRRILKSGGKIWLNSDITSKYYNQPTLGKFYHKQFYKEAPYNAYMWLLAPYSFAIRHAVTGGFSLGILGGLALSFISNWFFYPFIFILILYFSLALLSSTQQAVRYRQPFYILLLPTCFFLFHFIHGLGVLFGVLRIITGTLPFNRSSEPWHGAGRYRAYSYERS